MDARKAPQDGRGRPYDAPFSAFGATTGGVFLNISGTTSLTMRLTWQHIHDKSRVKQFSHVCDQSAKFSDQRTARRASLHCATRLSHEVKHVDMTFSYAHARVFFYGCGDFPGAAAVAFRVISFMTMHSAQNNSNAINQDLTGSSRGGSLTWDSKIVVKDFILLAAGPG